MNYTKHPLDYQQILQLLKDRGLIIRDVKDFRQQLKSLLKAHPNVDVTAMGFPSGWENEPLWRI
jgi:hypothetical protein